MAYGSRRVTKFIVLQCAVIQNYHITTKFVERDGKKDKYKNKGRKIERESEKGGM